MVFTENCYMCRHRLLSMYIQECSMYLSLLVRLCTQTVCFCPCVYVCVCVCVCVCVPDCVCSLSLSLSLSGPVCVSQQGWYRFGSTRLFRSSFERWGWASQRKADGAAAKWTRITTEPNEFSLITIHPTPRSTPCPRTTHANTTPLTHTIKTPNKLRQAHSHTHECKHINHSTYAQVHTLMLINSCSILQCHLNISIYTQKTLYYEDTPCFSRQIKVAPLFFINKWPYFYCVWCITAGYSEEKCFYNLSLKCKSFLRLWNNIFADATRAAWAGRNNIIQ